MSAATLVSAGLFRFEGTVPELSDGDYTVAAETAGVRSQKFGRLRIRRN